ncbi:MAG: TRAP transporter substrate-binding protein [Desulfofustis sp.]|nr:TRAP transporter substrate-binding protein [Desulfofustis sp.]
MRSRFLVKLGLLAATVFMLMALAVSGYSADKQKIRLASEYPDKHPTIKNGVMPWIEEVSEKTGGNLKIQFFNPNALAPAKEANAALMSGAADMIFTPSQMSARGKFPISSVALLPFMNKTAEAGSRMVWELYEKYPEMQKEFADMKVLWQWVSAPFEVHTTKKDIQTLEDIQGLKLIVWTGDLARMVSALGANPVETTPHDTYLSLQRGMADGVVCPIAPMKAYKISDVTKYHIILGLMTTHFYAGVNLDKWNSLPADMQQVLVDTTGLKMVEVSGKTLDTGAAKDTEWMKEKGHKFTVLSEEERAKWQAKTQPIVDEWVKKMEDQGFSNARQIVEDAYALSAK